MTLNLKDLAHQARIYSTDDIRDTTFDNWLKALRPGLPVSIAEIPVDEIDFIKVRDYRTLNLQKNGGPWSKNTMYTRLNSLTAIVNIAIQEQLLPAGTKNVFKGEAKKYTPGRQPRPEFREWEYFEPYHNDPLFNLYWYHGPRLAEFAGLLPEDIKIDAPIPHFIVRDNSNRLLKNLVSDRLVPIHKNCMDIARDTSLFPFSTAKRCGASWSYRFGQTMQLPKGQAQKVLRHSWRTRAARARIGWHFQVAIMGHVLKGHTADYGELLLEDINAELQKIR